MAKSFDKRKRLRETLATATATTTTTRSEGMSKDSRAGGSVSPVYTRRKHDVLPEFRISLQSPENLSSEI